MSLRKHLISNACIILSMSAVMVHVSHAYKNMDAARERISLILELMVSKATVTERHQHGAGASANAVVAARFLKKKI